MLIAKRLILQFWVESLNCDNYIVNCTPTKDLKYITSKEAWSKIKPDAIHFQVFDSKAWAHIPHEKSKPLHPKSEKCIFVGYSEEVKGYRFIQSHSNDIIII